MMDLSIKEFVQILFSVFGGGLAAYTAIRTDIAGLKTRMLHVEAAIVSAHGRVDSILMGHKK